MSCLRPVIACAAALYVLAGPSLVSEYQSAKKKIDTVVQDRAPRGALITLSKSELNAFLQTEVPGVAPEGIRDPRVELGEGRATGTMFVDMLKLRQSKGIEDGWLMSRLLSGERPLKVTVRIQSWTGRGRVDIERVELSGVPLTGAPLDFLVRHYVQPYVPTVKFGETFDWAHGVDRLDLKPDAIRMQMKK